MSKRFKRGLPVGVDVETGKPVALGLERLTEHVDIVGPTGCGKTRSMIFPLFSYLTTIPQATVIVMSPKGDLCPMARDWAIAHGLTSRLAVFDPQETIVGFNPLRRNGWPATRQAKVARSAVRASSGQRSFDETPQLARLLYLCLAVALEQRLTFVEAVRLLQPGKSPFRRGMLGVVQDEFLRESLGWFDALNGARQEELAASTLARLESFIADPLIRSILTERDRCLDLGDIIANRKILLINLELYKPLVPDDVRTLGRLMLNNILAHVFARPKSERAPVYLLIDEVQQFATEDLADALTLGRELGLHCILAHQFPSQLKLKAEDSNLFEAVLHCCRTKVVFGGMHVDDLEGITKDLMIDQFNPWTVKDERKALELEPVESTRDVVSNGRNIGASWGINKSSSSAVGRGTSHSHSRQWGSSDAHSDAFSMMHSAGVTSGMTNGETLLPSGDVLSIVNTTDGASAVDANGMTTADSYGQFQAEGEQDATSETHTQATQTGSSLGINQSLSQSRSTVPFYEYIKRSVVSGRTFLAQDEFLTLCLQKIKAQARSHFVIKVPDHEAIFVRAPFVSEPWIANATRTRALERIYESLSPPAVSYQPPQLMLESSTRPATLVPETLHDEDLYQ